MAQYGRTPDYTRAGTSVGTAEYDEGLRRFMIGIYNYMLAGLALTGVVAFAVYSAAVTGDSNAAAVIQGQAAAVRKGVFLTDFGVALYASPLKWVLAFSPLVFVLVLNFGLQRMSPGMTQISFWAFAVLMGASISSIFLVYTDASIARVFFITAIMFGATSLWGYTTKKDLSSWGSFLIMGVIGLIIASVVNIFLGSSVLEFAVSLIGVVIFTGLTAFYTQEAKNMYLAGLHGDMVTKGSVIAALGLYLSFINLFMMLLSLLGNRE